ncbi:hypothetical protein ANCCEY_05373 [Ancylostoma ceylanicum]|uniref:Serpentine receptor class gamma n=1 Tax=Ancylostoma ceylanicum TaxID=53326 RepID=A0A0D6LZM3_9BILA|nr:hypothetical protein ANCCEY_05373 [Ancylostoma ceylanicum]
MGDTTYSWTLDAQFVISTITVLCYGFCDIIGNFAVEWVRTDRKAGFGPPTEPFTRVMYTLTGVTFFTHLIGSLLMTLNRYTAVCFPWAYGKIWTRKNVYIMLVLNVIVSIAVHSQIFFIRLVYKRMANGWTDFGRDTQIPVVRAISSCAAIIYGCVSVVLISRTVYVVLKVKNKSKRCQRKEARAPGRALRRRELNPAPKVANFEGLNACQLTAAQYIMANHPSYV